jgi:putative ABC transport system substrate-binding protein
VTFFGGSTFDAKRLELMRDLVPAAKVVGVLGDPTYPSSLEAGLPATIAAGRALGREIVVARAAKKDELGSAFETMRKAGIGALMLSGSPFFTSERHEIIAFSARHAIPAIYDLRVWVRDGGLMSYSASITGAYRQAGVYVGKILKGAKPQDLPVLQPVTFELALNLKTAKAFGLEVPPSIHLRADEVIE